MGIKLYKACDMSTLTIINNVKMYCCIIYSSEKDRHSVPKINWKVKNKKKKTLKGTTDISLMKAIHHHKQRLSDLWLITKTCYFCCFSCV